MKKKTLDVNFIKIWVIVLIQGFEVYVLYRYGGSHLN